MGFMVLCVAGIFLTIFFYRVYVVRWRFDAWPALVFVLLRGLLLFFAEVQGWPVNCIYEGSGVLDVRHAELCGH